MAWVGAHRHDCWTALLSFGADRILTVDAQPVLLRDGDLIVPGNAILKQNYNRKESINAASLAQPAH